QERQFYWWLGHVVTVCYSILYLSSAFSLYPIATYYKRAYLGVILSYGVVIYNSIGVTLKGLDANFFSDENVHYLAMAYYWYSYKPITAIIPIFEPKQHSSLYRLDHKIQQFTKEYHPMAVYYAAHIEVIGILGRLVLGVLAFDTSIIALIAFINFLRLRYILSPHTRNALHTVTKTLDRWLLVDYKHIKVVSNLYLSLKRLIIRHGHIAQQQQQQQQQLNIKKKDIK
ncbi:hypothetical protein K501DRAFT_188425, partial [Backusella circina FSU 941]